MNLPKKPAFGRAAAKHTLKPNPEGLTAFDDLLDINTQSGSQWDGFRHFGHLSHQRFYNNLTKEEALSGTLRKATALLSLALTFSQEHDAASRQCQTTASSAEASC